MRLRINSVGSHIESFDILNFSIYRNFEFFDISKYHIESFDISYRTCFAAPSPGLPAFFKQIFLKRKLPGINIKMRVCVLHIKS